MYSSPWSSPMALVCLPRPPIMCTPCTPPTRAGRRCVPSSRARPSSGSIRMVMMAPRTKGSLPQVASSASIRDGALTVSLVNTHAAEPVEVSLALYGADGTIATRTTLASDDIHAHNTFDEPTRVAPRVEHPGLAADGATVTLPPASVTTLTIAL
ncbi:MAG: alpha-L-arabinofuranosidase C-terminal domain-containing protein [Anaerolineae bacterium]